jgi:hypothetical protein
MRRYKRHLKLDCIGKYPFDASLCILTYSSYQPIMGSWGRIRAGARMDAHLLRAAGFIAGTQERYPTWCCQFLRVYCEVPGPWVTVLGDAGSQVQDVLSVLLTNCGVQERQSRVCSTVAIAIVVETRCQFAVNKLNSCGTCAVLHER